MSILLAFIVFSIVVISHEWGHFYAARKCGILVEEFAIGMGPKLFSVKPGETVYSIRLFPIGGSCRMLGDGEIANSNEAVNNDEAVNNERSYTAKPVWKRMIVILAGVVMNFILAFIIAVAFVLRNGFSEPVPLAVIDDTPAQAAGLMADDRIVRANNTVIKTYNDFAFFMATKADGSPIMLEVKRGGETVEMTVTPRLDAEGYKIGFRPSAKFGVFSDKGENPYNLQTAGLSESIGVASNNVSGYVKSTVVGLSRLFSAKANMDDMSGPIGIVSIIGESYEESITDTDGMQRTVAEKAESAIWTLLLFAAIISANLAVLNLLPLPVLDGGRMVFLTIEAIRGKPMNPEREGMAQMASFVLLMVLAVIVAYNDIMKLM